MKFKEGELVWGGFGVSLLHVYVPQKFSFSLKITGGRKKSSKLFGVFVNVSSDYTSLISVEIYVDYNIVSAHLGQYHIVITIYFDLYELVTARPLYIFDYLGVCKNYLTRAPRSKNPSLGSS